ncbi:MAG TPA: adenosylcobinamide-GDP ribazoletransferase [Methanothrix sp.]|nr:adenosylcobinamide-GDP ribazoletransferase [Methanothrix sp.]HOV82502.1 adenosylcobinamide-GDP ribazoletransferase [Methanothrix sp.]HPC90084.1 adenosylcobinamide-GDP ribazoletransferase [Methanothrix sp.]HQE87936.1 adenosylcobinamide-GDP ribazoletransferase [Methanothrix sp.]HQI68480.1 adenosylcobinamide-GDP ribazoletransferase [Methanothrix sp.]
MKDILFALKSGFGWLSSIPVGISMEGVEALMRHVYVFPLVGAVLGAIFGAVGYGAALLLPANLAAVLVIAAIYRLCGINHMDGLADFGDGVIAHGSREKKIAAMKDVSLGTGGAVFIAILLLASYAVLSDMPRDLLPLALLAAEVSAKQAMIAFAAFSASLQKGFGQMMIERTGGRQFFIGLFISALLCAAALGPLGLAALAAAHVAAFYLILVARRNFGGATGDGIGAANEIARVAALAAALCLGGVLPWTPW